MGRYKLCRVHYSQDSTVKVINEDGVESDTLCSYSTDEDEFYYAIYENIGDDGEEEWDEWGYYDQDLERAVEDFNKLKEN